MNKLLYRKIGKSLRYFWQIFLRYSLFACLGVLNFTHNTALSRYKFSRKMHKNKAVFWRKKFRGKHTISWNIWKSAKNLAWIIIFFYVMLHVFIQQLSLLMNNNLWGLLVYSRLLIQYRGTGFKLFGWIKSTSWQRIIWLCPYKHISLSWLSWPREMVRYLELSQIHNISIFRMAAPANPIVELTLFVNA